VSTLNFVLRQFSLDVQKAFVRQCVQILLLYRYSYFVAVPERCVGELYVWVSILTMRSSKIGSSLSLGYQSSQMLCTANPKDFKNVTFDTLSFFFCLMKLDERVLSNCDVTGLAKKNALSLCIRSVPFSTSISHSRYHYRTCNLTVISSRKSSNRPF